MPGPQRSHRGHLALVTRRQFLGRLGIAASALCAKACGQGGSGAPAAARPDFFVGVGIENSWMVQVDPAMDGNRRALDEFALTGHDDQWREDFLLAADLGINCMRYGMPWPRIEASPGVFDFSALRTRLEFLATLGITPILDLIHYGTPAWMKDGIGDPQFPDALDRYAQATASNLGGLVRHFTPYNEPQVAAAQSGALGIWPPYASDAQEYARIGVRVARALVLASRTLRANLPGCRLISAESINWSLADTLLPDLAARGALDEDLRVAVGSFPASHAYGKVPPEHAWSARLASLGVPRADLDWLHANAQPPDILGYNHYPDIVDFPGGPDFTRGGSVPLDAAADEAASRVEQGLRRARDYFGRDVYLTETSAGLDPAARAAYAMALGRMVGRLRAQAFPLVGMNWWPLIEAVRFEYRDEVSEPLGAFLVPGEWNNGLYDLVAEPDGRLRRVPTVAVTAYRNLAQALRQPFGARSA